MSNCEAFSSKILLFGEYSVIRNSKALSIPYHLFEGILDFHAKDSKGRVVKDTELKAYLSYIKKLIKRDELTFDFDIEGLEKDISEGLFFKSSIPVGYGVGSSGAVCAALLRRYGTVGSDDISELKRIFSVMESHFHGASSGIDPLISYLDEAILIGSNNEIGKVEIPKYTQGKGGIFLLNTNRSRRTEPLVNLFLEKCNTENFADLCDNVLIPITDKCVSSFLEGKTRSLYEFFRELSDFQYRHFLPMVPKLYQDLWKEGLKNENFYLKLCGAGGGGFLLGMTKDFAAAEEILGDHCISPLYSFDFN